MKAFDSMEEQTTYADKLTKFFVAGQRSQQASWIGDVVKKQNENVLSAMDAYQEKTAGGFVDKRFGKTFGVISGAANAITSVLDANGQIDKKKVQEVQDA